MTLHEMEVASLTETQQAHYKACIAKGESPKMALMLASRQSAMMGGSDRAFNEGARRKMNSMPAVNRNMHYLAKQAGINTEGKYHVSCLGRYDNPLAWVSTIEDVKTSLKMQGISARGLVNYQHPEAPPPEQTGYRLADDIVDEELKKRLSQEENAKVLQAKPKKRAALLREMADEIREHHGRRGRGASRGGTPGEGLIKSIAETRSLQSKKRL